MVGRLADGSVNTPQMQSTVSFLLDMLEDMYGTYSVHNNFLVSAVTRFQNQELGLWFINNSAFGFANAPSTSAGVLALRP